MKPTATKTKMKIEDRIARQENRLMKKMVIICSVVGSILAVGGIAIVNGDLEKMVRDLMDIPQDAGNGEGGAHQKIQPSKEYNP